MAILSIILNSSDLQRFWILIFTGVWFRQIEETTSVEKFQRAIAILNSVAIAQFFEAIYTDIFKYLFAIGTTNGGLLRLVLTYFETGEING